MFQTVWLKKSSKITYTIVESLFLLGMYTAYPEFYGNVILLYIFIFERL
jgi:hypothetical protein